MSYDPISYAIPNISIAGSVQERIKLNRALLAQKVKAKQNAMRRKRHDPIYNLFYSNKD